MGSGRGEEGGGDPDRATPYFLHRLHLAKRPRRCASKSLWVRLGCENFQCQNFSGKGNAESFLEVSEGIENIATDTQREIRGDKDESEGRDPQRSTHSVRAYPRQRTLEALPPLHGPQHREETRLSHSLTFAP